MTTSSVKDARRADAPLWVMALLIFGSVVSSTLLIPIVRPFMSAVHPGQEWAMHAFMSVNMLGAILGAPFLCVLADRRGNRQRLVVVLAVLDGTLLLMCSLPMPIYALLVVRTLQGAANVGGLSILLGSVRRGGIRRGESGGHGAAMGAAGAAIMAAVAVGSPLGTLLLQWGPTTPLRVGALLPFAIAGACLRIHLPKVPEARGVGIRAVLRTSPLLRLPLLWVGVERFVVGCFVVTFALYAHRVLNLGDAHVGALFSWFLLPFALATYPMGRYAERLNRTVLVSGGMAVYGFAFVFLGLTPVWLLAAVMLLAGLASAAIYAPSLCFAASLVAPEVRATSMSLLNSAGSAGMMLGTAMAGIASATLRSRIDDDATLYPMIFAFAGVAQLITLALTFRSLRKLAAQEARTRSLFSPQRPVVN